MRQAAVSDRSEEKTVKMERTWQKTLERLETLLATQALPDHALEQIAALVDELRKTLEQQERESIDVRDYCDNYHQPLCITDEQGRIIYLNQLYAAETLLDAEKALGKQEPFSDPISTRVLQDRTVVTFGNDGSRLGLKHGRFVSGVPIFDSNGAIKNVVITLSSEDAVYKRYRELRDMMNRRESIQIIDSDSDNEVLQSMLGKAPAIREIRGKVRKVAPTDATILIMGESGSGKEVLADCIYELSRRKGKPYVKINCAAIPPNLLEAELFGYEKGAFTGANSRKIGLFEAANHGTILLDEIGDFPLELQPKLLRVLQQQELYRIGCNTPVKIDVRVIAATNADLKQRIQDGRFREDLYYRISVFPIWLPPLRDRREDIRGLAYHFVYRFSKKYGRTVQLPDDVVALFERYRWPGNVREMQNVVEYFVICYEDGQALTPEQLALVLQASAQDISGMEQELPPPQPEQLVPDKEELPEGTLFELRDQYEKKLIENALRKTKSARQAAQLLGIFPSSLYRKTQKYGIVLDDSAGLEE